MAVTLPVEPVRARLKVLVPDDYGDRARHLECVGRFADFDLNDVRGPVRDQQELAVLLTDARLAGE